MKLPGPPTCRSESGPGNLFRPAVMEEANRIGFRTRVRFPPGPLTRLIREDCIFFTDPFFFRAVYGFQLYLCKTVDFNCANVMLHTDFGCTCLDYVIQYETKSGILN